VNLLAGIEATKLKYIVKKPHLKPHNYNLLNKPSNQDATPISNVKTVIKSNAIHHKKEE